MKRILYPVSFLLFFIFSCNDQDKPQQDAENDVDAAREFIRSALDGDFDRARTYLVNDSLNREDLAASERLYKERMKPEDKARYKDASIIVHDIRRIDDSTRIVYYSNTYRNQKDSLKVVKMSGKWLVDFKYIFKHQPDSSR